MEIAVKIVQCECELNCVVMNRYWRAVSRPGRAGGCTTELDRAASGRVRAPSAPSTSQGQWSLWSCSLSPPGAHWLLVIGLCLVCAGKQQNAVNTPSSAINNTDPSPGNILRHPASRAAVIMHYAHYGHVDPMDVHECFIAF